MSPIVSSSNASARLTPPTTGRLAPGWRRAANVALGAVVVLVLGFTLARYFVFQVVTVEDDGMFPGLARGDELLVDRWSESYEPGDVVVFVKAERYFVRRVVAVGGDVAALRAGRLWLNGFEPEVEPRAARGYVSAEPGREGRDVRCERALESVGFSSREVCLGGADMAELQVAEGSYLALCDNRADCRADSRDLGVIPRGAIRGRATHRRGGEGDLWSRVFGQWEEL